MSDVYGHRATPAGSLFSAGSYVRVKPEFDIPSIFRFEGQPSRGVVDHVADDGTLIVVVEGKSVPYKPEEVEPDA